MKRLTQIFNERYIYLINETNTIQINKDIKDDTHSLNPENSSYITRVYAMGEAIDKLAEFEDFMEEQGFESLEELKCNIECLKEEIEWGTFNYNELFKSREELYKENQALRDRWDALHIFARNRHDFNLIELLEKMEE